MTLDLEVDKKFWKKSFFLGKVFFIIGAFFIELAMNLSGYFRDEKKDG